MKTQKQCLALHLGRWEGIFWDFAPPRNPDENWQQVGCKKSVISFEQANPDSIRQTNAYYAADADLKLADPGHSMSWIYQDFAQGLRFFEDGSFSNGRMQLAPFADFGIEQGFLYNDRKVRLVQQWDPDGKATSAIGIYEMRPTWTDPQLRLASPDRLLGSWRGVVTTYSAQTYTPTQGEVELHFERQSDSWQETMRMAGLTVPLQAQIEPNQLRFASGSMRFWPGDLFVYGPERLPVPTQASDRSFRLGLGWLPDSDVYLRLIRQYDAAGSWQSIAHITARRVG